MRLTSNGWYLTLDGVDVKAYVVSVGVSQSVETKETTAGPKNHEQKQAGLRKTSYKITLVYEIGSVSAYIQKVKPGASYVLEYGPESNASGKPRQQQTVLVTNVEGPSMTASKDLVVFDITAEGADEPTVDMVNGAVYP